jgi:DNA mismatch repair ATPase MutL
MVMVVSETQTQTPKEETKKTKTKKTKKKAKEETKETKPTPTPTTIETKPKEEVKETKPKTKETKPTTKPPTKKRPKIKPTTWEKFEKFTSKQGKEEKSWIKEVLEKAKKEPIEIRGLTRGQLTAPIVQVNRHNQNHEPKLNIKYDFKKGIVLIAPIKVMVNDRK